MLDTNFLVREPLLDPKQKIVGYELSLQGADGPVSNGGGSVELADFLANQLNQEETGWLLGDTLIFLDASPTLILSGVLTALPAGNIVLAVPASDFSNVDLSDALQVLRNKGFGILLRDADLAGSDKELIRRVSYIEIRYDSSAFAEQAKWYASLRQTSVRMAARGVTSWQALNDCASLGFDAFVGTLYLSERPGGRPKGLNPAQAMILQLMDMVRKNADVRQLEGVLKRDAGLSYKLLRYINSAGFGLGVQIQSLRHAVSMLGYSPLYRWLSVLLASASNAGYSPVLMHTAVVRGRFAELLGQGFIPKAEIENLFVAGMFSLLDRLLGIPMEQVLENIQLSEAVTQALRSREGMYGPFLALAEACEQNNGNIGELADSLFVSPLQVNEAHLAALVWAQNLKL